nr:FkbM family methyltransferase [Acetobacter estunensis]
MDVGANTGIYSILACAADPRVHVKAFEPFPEILKVLEHNIALNDFGDRIAVYPVALSDRSEQVALYVPEKTEGVLETSCSLEASFKGNCPSHVDVMAQTLDSLKLKEPISLVKVDIEGHEHAFLAGGYQTIQKDRPILLVEVLPPAQFQGLQDFLSSSGYRDFRLRPQTVIEAQEVTYDAEAWNHAFVPPERMSFFLKCCEICGLQVQRIGA